MQTSQNVTQVQASGARRFVREIIGYGVVSAIALAADLTMLFCLVKLAGLHYLPASALAFVTGALVAYLLSVKYVFQSRRLSSSSMELGCFVALGGAGLAVNAATLFVAVGKAGLNLLAAKLLAAGCTFATNFALRRQLLFTLPGRFR